MRLASLAGLLVAGSVGWAAWRHIRHEEAFALVRLAATAHERVSYAGEVISRQLHWGRPVGVRHDARSGRTLYRWSRRHSYVTTRRSTEAPDPAGWCIDPTLLRDNYRASVGAECVFLERPARLLRLTPRDRERPILQLTVDKETNLPLRVASFFPDGQLAFVAEYRRLRIGAQEIDAPDDGDAAAERSVPLRAMQTADAVDRIGFRPLLPDYLPNGWGLVDSAVSGVGVRSLELVYSDGVNCLVLRQRRVPTPAQVETEYRLRYGHREAIRRLAWDCQAGKRAIVASNGNGAGGVIAKRRRIGHQRHYELNVEGLEVELYSPAYIEPVESIRMLRSLRRP